MKRKAEMNKKVYLVPFPTRTRPILTVVITQSCPHPCQHVGMVEGMDDGKQGVGMSNPARS